MARFRYIRPLCGLIYFVVQQLFLTTRLFQYDILVCHKLKHTKYQLFDLFNNGIERIRCLKSVKSNVTKSVAIIARHLMNFGGLLGRVENILKYSAHRVPKCCYASQLMSFM